MAKLIVAEGAGMVELAQGFQGYLAQISNFFPN
jgi:hypothetical protein